MCLQIRAGKENSNSPERLSTTQARIKTRAQSNTRNMETMETSLDCRHQYATTLCKQTKRQHGLNQLLRGKQGTGEHNQEKNKPMAMQKQKQDQNTNQNTSS